MIEIVWAEENDFVASVAECKHNVVLEDEFKQAWGCGVVVTQEDIDRVVAQVVEEERAVLEENGWGYKARLIPKVRKQLQFASGKLVNEALDRQLVSVLGENTADAKAKFQENMKKKRKQKKKEQKQEQKAAEQAVTQQQEEKAEEKTEEHKHDGGQKVTPWEASADKEFDYNRLIEHFGSQHLTQEHLDKIAALGIPVHHFLKRNIFFSHRDFDTVLEKKAKGEPIFLYTGRGPSSQAMHLGHLIPFLFTKYLQEAFDLPLVIQMTDDEKFLFKRNLTLDDDPETGVAALCRENVKDIIAVGFDPDKTFIFSDLQYMGGDFYRNVVRFERCVTLNQAMKIFDFTRENNIGQISFCAIQAVPSFPSSFPGIIQPGAHCLIPCAIDQDPYFRLTRDVAPRLGYEKPSLLHSVFFPAMTGGSSKMSSSANAVASIFLTDDQDTVRSKIFKYAFSGAPNTLKEFKEQGADLDADISYQYLRFFMEDDEKLEAIGSAYAAGDEKMTTAAVKEELTKVLQHIVKQHQERRAQVTDADVEKFMTPRKLGGQSF
ncbi:hypothetical protein PTSG_04448 [Salpingoeca rosetta]|uniref:Tryptophan--tRNA ligase, cytoplasmic n=1 Tax=Salpingoeca rosetta (strain ATCC 50818 / BSB-021) TaxID=946362 RepID=F2U8L2_SALR5|nr:uncharacterized protein PTSG_04448 [Salpingoeca rosetta]EGD72720.1 hypothetical protein PTSG_04448 [Salpingoeca rosetta]|eukprot:XP_004994543.1 hypothetical protein PTSG_04448 [Salpingoeca rosetta]